MRRSKIAKIKILYSLCIVFPYPLYLYNFTVGRLPAYVIHNEEISFDHFDFCKPPAARLVLWGPRVDLKQDEKISQQTREISQEVQKISQQVQKISKQAHSLRTSSRPKTGQNQLANAGN